MLIEFLFYYCFCFCFCLCFCFFFLIENLDRDQRRNLFAQEQSKKVFLFWMSSFLVVLEWWPVAVILITTLTKQFWQLLCHLFPERNTSENEDAVNAKEEAAICRQLAGVNSEIKIQSQFYSIFPFSRRYVPPPSNMSLLRLCSVYSSKKVLSSSFPSSPLLSSSSSLSFILPFI